ncbi:ribonuclease Z [Pyrococcus sp. ST04]|uniref:ribonuclease Z n=1 Tax=Pyrococcus sp. ST04 TaxID=1183377 RepID=UPI0002605DF8|nr:ribonuclease Z [Pyrococcus sp. ST04]AFK22530.1 Ribonuclease Z [Pyrococcus sp. ST04]
MITLTFLGTGGIKPTPERNVPSIAIKIGKEVILFDCGEGTLRQLEISGISPMKISKIFITHFHGDHYIGLLSLIQTMNLWDRKEPLEIYGPPGAVTFVKNLLRTGYFLPTFKIIINEVWEGDVIKNKEYKVVPFEVSHGVPALGYVFKERDKRGNFDLEKIKRLGLSPGPWMKELEKRGKIEISGIEIRLEDVTGPKKRGAKIVYTGDTEPITLGDLCKDCDMLIHEATYISPEDRGESYHSTIGEACNSFVESRCKVLALFHRGPRYKYSEYKIAAKKICPQAYVPRDFDRILAGNGNVIFEVR